MQFGTWFTDTEPKWKIALNNCDDYALEQKGLERKEVEELLQRLMDLDVVH